MPKFQCLQPGHTWTADRSPSISRINLPSSIAQLFPLLQHLMRQSICTARPFFKILPFFLKIFQLLFSKNCSKVALKLLKLLLRATDSPSAYTAMLPAHFHTSIEKFPFFKNPTTHRSYLRGPTEPKRD